MNFGPCNVFLNVLGEVNDWKIKNKYKIQIMQREYNTYMV